MEIRDVYLLERSEQFNLGPRQEVTVDLSLKKAPKKPCTVLAGGVADKCESIEGATVKIFSRNNKPITHAVTDHRGNFIFENILPPGEYQVIATAEGYKVSKIYNVYLEPKRPISICICLDVSDIMNHAVVYGIVYNEVNLALADAHVLIEDYYRPKICEAITQTNADGQFLIYGLKPKKYWISAFKQGYLSPKKISFKPAAKENTCMNLFVYPDESSTGGTISGIIDFYGQNVSNAVAALYKVEERGHILLSTKETNERGFYLFPNVEPGEYLVKSKMETDDKIR